MGIYLMDSNMSWATLIDPMSYLIQPMSGGVLYKVITSFDTIQFFVNIDKWFNFIFGILVEESQVLRL